MLYQLGKNLNRYFFVEFVTRLSDLEEREGALGRDDKDGGDTIIDMFLHTYVNEYCEGVRCTRTHFMTKLLEGIEGDSDIDAVESTMENYCKVQDWDHGSVGGLAALDYLFVPINVENWHWIFLSVDLKGRKICLYDSMGSADPRNRKYLAAIRRYLYDADFENDEDRAEFDTGS